MGTKIEADLRFGLWMAYDRRCGYTGNFILNYQDLIIDHIIPKDTDAHILEAKKRKHKLSDEFYIHDPQNLMPCLARPNMIKGKKPFDEHAEIFYLQMAKKKIIAVEQARQLFFKSLGDGLAIAKEEYVRNQLPKIESKPFEKHRDIFIQNESWGHSTYNNSDSFVRIDGYLPSFFNEKGGAIIQFKGESSMFQVYHYQILEMIKKWDGLDIDQVIAKIPSYNGEKFFVNLYGIAIHLGIDAFEQFRNILSDFLIEYQKQYIHFLNYLEIEEFELTSDSLYCVLKTAYRSEWKALLDYSWKYDLDKGVTEEFCFNANITNIVCTPKNSNFIKFWLTPRAVQHRFDSFTAPDYEMEILWRLPAEYDRGKIKTGEVWTARQTLNWVNHTLATISINLSNEKPEFFKKLRSKFRL